MNTGIDTLNDRSRYCRLRFFCDLTQACRREILLRLLGLPTDLEIRNQHAEKILLRQLLPDRVGEVEAEIQMATVGLIETASAEQVFKGWLLSGWGERAPIQVRGTEPFRAALIVASVAASQNKIPGGQKVVSVIVEDSEGKRFLANVEVEWFPRINLAQTGTFKLAR